VVLSVGLSQTGTGLLPKVKTLSHFSSGRVVETLGRADLQSRTARKHVRQTRQSNTIGETRNFRRTDLHRRPHGYHYLEGMGSFDTLLDLQGIDTTLAQLLHRRAHLPEQQQLNEIEKKQTALRKQLAPTVSVQEELDKRQAALETQIHEIDGKIESASKQLYSGTVTASRELQALEADIASLKKHRNELEDVELGVLMEREPVDAILSQGAAERDRLDAEGAKWHVAIAEAIVSIETQRAELTARRSDVAASVATENLQIYERIRSKNGGVGIARLEHGTCMSCRMKLSAVQLDTLKKVGESEPAYCDECGALLVR
jgi:uncharacterized protein